MKKDILYLMHIPWGWIKQRPHFLAELLANDFDIDVICKYPFKVKRTNLINKLNRSLNIKSYIKLPFDKYHLSRNKKFFSKINQILFSLTIKKNQFYKYDYVWITSVSLYPVIEHLLTDRTNLIWDCMDDELEFNHIRNNYGTHEKYKEYELKLMKRANIILCSSRYLSIKIQNRSNIYRDINIVNNGIELPPSPMVESQVDEQISKELKLISVLPNVFMYIGTISEWFDFDLLLKALEENSNMNIVLIGPSDVPIIEHKNITHLGVKDRKWIFHYMSIATALIMPFKVNELIRSVNPVKLYEYIYANRPILVPNYEEIDNFEGYVYRYDTDYEFSILAGKIISGEVSYIKSELQNKEFISSNQWKNRYQQIKEILI